MSKRLFFRVDASPEIGLGHLRRCWVLAQRCRRLGAECHFLVRRREFALPIDGEWKDAIVHDIPWDCDPQEDALLTMNWCLENQVWTGVLDHYRLDESYQKILERGGVKWLQFGNKRHAHPLLGAWVHDASPGASSGDYQTRRANPETFFLTGPRFALVGESFVETRATLQAPVEQEVRSILLTFGGGDDFGAFGRALDWLDAVGFSGRRVVLTTGLNPRLSVLRKRAAKSPCIEMQVDNWSPASVMASCQLAICAGGTSLHEFACLGVPTIIVCTADNQVAPACAWQEAGFGKNLGSLEDIDETQAIQVIEQMIGDHQSRLDCARACWSSQDGLGASRVASCLIA